MYQVQFKYAKGWSAAEVSCETEYETLAGARSRFGAHPECSSTGNWRIVDMETLTVHPVVADIPRKEKLEFIRARAGDGDSLHYRERHGFTCGTAVGRCGFQECVWHRDVEKVTLKVNRIPSLHQFIRGNDRRKDTAGREKFKKIELIVFCMEERPFALYSKPHYDLGVKDGIRLTLRELREGISK